MPRRNRRVRQNDPVSFAVLAQQLREEWAVQTGRTTWDEVRQARRDARKRVRFGEGAVGDPAARRAEAARAAREAARPVSVEDARAKLAAYLA